MRRGLLFATPIHAPAAVSKAPVDKFENLNCISSLEEYIFSEIFYPRYFVKWLGFNAGPSGVV
ncbi:uncharacterized protein METZ01_LOCUS508155 [marine metagenome]|uniref:Uncharacterized protein n=1 Tax=marine metagenome TaxID=408172 RepID=A0A383EEY9_9ZZZZ